MPHIKCKNWNIDVANPYSGIRLISLAYNAYQNAVLYFTNLLCLHSGRPATRNPLLPCQVLQRRGRLQSRLPTGSNQSQGEVARLIMQTDQLAPLRRPTVSTTIIERPPPQQPDAPPQPGTNGSPRQQVGQLKPNNIT